MSKHHSEPSAPPIEYCPTCGQPLRRRIPIGDDDDEDEVPFTPFAIPSRMTPQQFQQKRPKGGQPPPGKYKGKGNRPRHQGGSFTQTILIIIGVGITLLVLASQK